MVVTRHLLSDDRTVAETFSLLSVYLQTLVATSECDKLTSLD